MKRPPRHPQREPICGAVTPALRAIESVPPGARWRVSWLALPIGPHSRRQSSYLFTDASAQRWCAAQGIAFPGDQAASARGPVVVTSLPAAVPPPDTYVDARARAAGEHL